MKNLKRIIGGIMIAFFIAGVVAALAYEHGLQSALIAFGVSLVVLAFLSIAAF